MSRMATPRGSQRSISVEMDMKEMTTSEAERAEQSTPLASAANDAGTQTHETAERKKSSEESSLSDEVTSDEADGVLKEQEERNQFFTQAYVDDCIVDCLHCCMQCRII